MKELATAAVVAAILYALVIQFVSPVLFSVLGIFAALVLFPLSWAIGAGSAIASWKFWKKVDKK